MKILLLILTILIVLPVCVYGQSTQELIGQVAETYTGVDPQQGGGLIAGFSVPGLIGGLLFGAIGFVAFIYGKRNAEFKPLIIGLLLMVFPYFFKQTVVLYLIGGALTAALYFWRD